MPANAIPNGYHTITAQLSIDGAQAAIAFYEKAFGAKVLDTAKDPSGTKVMHAALRLETSMLFVNDVFPEMGGTPSHSSMWLYVADCDASFARAVEAGAKAKFKPMDMFWGDRMGQVEDPFGQSWTIATHTKDLTPEEIRAGEAAFLAGMKGNK